MADDNKDVKQDTSKELKEIVEKFAKTQEEFLSISDEHAKEIKELGDAKSETAEKLEKAAKALVEIEEKLKAHQERVDEIDKKMQQPTFPGGQEMKSPGQIVVESDQYKNNDGHNMRPVELKSFFPERKDVSTVVASGGYAVQAQRLPELYYDPGQRELHIRDIMNIGPTTSNAISFIRETAFTSNAEAVEENSEYGKPESDFTFEEFSVAVSTIAHWVPATRQCLSDVPIMMSYVSGRLTYGLKVQEDNDILYGLGTGGAMTGILRTIGLSNIARNTNESYIDQIRRAILQVRLSEYPADTVVLNPTDWCLIEQTKDTTGRYIWANIASPLAPRLWGLRVVESTAIPAGAFLCGAFRLGAQLWDREQANVRVSEHHEDYFTNNMVAILAEERLALTVFRPLAFCKGTF